MADNNFNDATVETKTDKNSDTNVKLLAATLDIPYEHKPSESFGMKFLFRSQLLQDIKRI